MTLSIMKTSAKEESHDLLSFRYFSTMIMTTINDEDDMAEVAGMMMMMIPHFLNCHT